MTKTLQPTEWFHRKQDPWRIRCPECDSTRVSYSVSCVQTKLESDTYHGDFDKVERFENGRKYRGRYRCDSCKATMGHVRDAKTDELVRKRRTTIQ